MNHSYVRLDIYMRRLYITRFCSERDIEETLRRVNEFVLAALFPRAILGFR